MSRKASLIFMVDSRYTNDQDFSDIHSNLRQVCTNMMSNTHVKGLGGTGPQCVRRVIDQFTLQSLTQPFITFLTGLVQVFTLPSGFYLADKNIGKIMRSVIFFFFFFLTIMYLLIRAVFIDLVFFPIFLLFRTFLYIYLLIRAGIIDFGSFRSFFFFFFFVLSCTSTC